MNNALRNIGGATGLGWQDAVVALLVLCALGYLVRRKMRARKRTAFCSDCPGCEAPGSTPGPAERPAERRTAELPIARITADNSR